MGPTDENHVRVHRVRVSLVLALIHKEKKETKWQLQNGNTKVEAAGNTLPSLTDDDDGRMLQKLRFLYDIVFAKDRLHAAILYCIVFLYSSISSYHIYFVKIFYFK